MPKIMRMLLMIVKFILLGCGIVFVNTTNTYIGVVGTAKRQVMAEHINFQDEMS